MIISNLNHIKSIFISLIILINISYLNGQNSTWNDTLGCISQPVPCNGNGLCLSTSNCICNTFYTGDNCEKTVIESNRVTIYRTGISLNSFVAAIILWIFGSLIIIFILILLWTRIRKDGIKEKKEKSKPNIQNPIKIESSNLVLNGIQKEPNEEKFQNSSLNNISISMVDVTNNPNDVSVPCIIDEDIPLRKNNKKLVSPLKPKNSVNQTQNTNPVSPNKLTEYNEANHDNKSSLANDLLLKLGKYEIKSMNHTDAYTKESQKFILECDNSRNLALNIGSNLTRSENVMNGSNKENYYSPQKNSKRYSSVLDQKQKNNAY